ncbi:Receptor-type guanylate cyclase gcy-25 [Dissostichus eleginoides]|uniref:Receptor-type guanylate cyclase gcy-25 n=1 Tax=Dissostichus eleginoides TaxID=100907 RepID=A0AAD9BWX9_DISEL|nr:Receptor-type guanylate cyclase gcy-25 [Dissostichus eleginoides]
MFLHPNVKCSEDKSENDKRIGKQIHPGGIDLVSFSIFTGAAVEQDLSSGAPETHICSETVLQGPRGPSNLKPTSIQLDQLTVGGSG